MSVVEIIRFNLVGHQVRQFHLTVEAACHVKVENGTVQSCGSHSPGLYDSSVVWGKGGSCSSAVGTC